MSELAMQEAERLFAVLGSMVEAAAERSGVPQDEISKQLWALMTGYVMAAGIVSEQAAIDWVRVVRSKDTPPP